MLAEGTPSTNAENFAAAPMDTSSRNTRACIRCGLVKTFDQFFESGCDNCVSVPMLNDRAAVSEHTSQQYSGLISIHDQNCSWAAKWLRKSKLKPGCYALQVDHE